VHGQTVDIGFMGQFGVAEAGHAVFAQADSGGISNVISSCDSVRGQEERFEVATNLVLLAKSIREPHGRMHMRS